VTGLDAVSKLSTKKDGQAVFLSSKDGWVPGEKTFVKFTEPEFSLYIRNGRATLKSKRGEERVEGTPVSILENLLGQGYYAAGYLGYEFFKFTERDFAPRPQKNGTKLPDACFMFFDDVAAGGKLGELEKETIDLSKINTAPRANMDKKGFLSMVKSVRDYIARGDVYQVNLSQRFDVPFKISPQDFFMKLYEKQPVPFACSLDFGDFQVTSGSMELFLRRTGKRLVTRPIKGTRARGRGEKEDKALKKELFESEKERAENLMIVDLMRNDLSRVCEFGSVKVNRLFEVEPYSTLHQMVSEVEGKLRDGVKTGDIIRATFPPGSVTGAPKRRAMEIIDELEPHLRGPYCGAIGVFGPDGDFTLSVAIRVFANSGGKGSFWVGGGITWNSVPEMEYEETLVKARAIMGALGVGE
jgi:aminodeoxychorismate synthase component I